MKPKKRLNSLHIKHIIFTNKLLYEPDKHKKNTSSYQILCSELNMKNDACNRKRLYTMWKVIYNEYIQNQTIAPVVSKDVSDYHEASPAVLCGNFSVNKNKHDTVESMNSKVMDPSFTHSSEVSFVNVVCSTPIYLPSANNSSTSAKNTDLPHNISVEAEEVHLNTPSPQTAEIKSSFSEDMSTKNPNVDLNISLDAVKVPNVLLNKPNPQTTEMKSSTFSENMSTSYTYVPLNISQEAEKIPKVLLNMSSPQTTEIKPQFSQNIMAIPKDNKHNILEGTFTMEKELWSCMFDDNDKLSTKYYPYIIRESITKNVNNTCILVCKYVKYLQKNKILIFAKCKHENCKTFKIYLSDMNVSVYSQSINFCHKQKFTGQVRGVERSIAKKKLTHQKPLKFKKQKLMNLKEAHFKQTRNLLEVKSDATVRKIRSEALAHNDRSNNELIDLFLYQKEHLNFVQEVSFPFCIKLFCEEQFKVLKCENKPLLHLDATGNIIRNPTKEESAQCNRILFYAGVIATAMNKRLYPVFAMLSSIHDTRAILKLLNDFKYMCQKNNNWPAFSGLVTDFSLAIINAACLSFNNCVLLDYLNMCYEIVNNGCTDNRLTEQGLTPLYLCVAHLMKNACKDIDNSNTVEKSFYKDLFAAICLCQDLQEVERLIGCAYVLLQTKKKTHTVVEALQKIKGVYNPEIKTTSNAVSTNEIPSDTKTTPQYKKNKFYIHIKRFVEIIVIQTDDVDGIIECNTFYDPALFVTILTKYVPFLPMWSNILKAIRYSNAAVENYFGQMKKYLLDGHPNMKTTQFLRKFSAEIVSLSKEVLLGVPKNKLSSKIDKDDVETWKRKSNKKNYSHFDGHHLQKKMKPSEIHLAEDEESLLICGYCGHGCQANAASIKWVECEICKKWIHVNCAKADDTNLSFSGTFICNVCKLPEDFDTTTVSANNCTDENLPKLTFYDNGLVKNENYYKNLNNNKGYVVTTMKNIKHAMKSLQIKDFTSLDPEMWLVSFVVDHMLYIYNQDRCNLVSVEKAFMVFGEFDLDEEFCKVINIDFEKDNVFPICKSDHYTMVILSLKRKQLTIIDPFGNEETYQDEYVEKIGTLLRVKNQYVDELNVIMPKHTKQRDGYSCGVIIIDLFKKILENDSLTSLVDYDSLRNDYKQILLEKSDDMSKLCLICARNVDKAKTFSCKVCNRKIHKTCILSLTELQSGLSAQEKIKKCNSICDLCRENN